MYIIDTLDTLDPPDILGTLNIITLKDYGEDDYYDRTQLFGFMAPKIPYTRKQLTKSIEHSINLWEAVSNGSSLYWIKYYDELKNHLEGLLCKYCRYEGGFYYKPENTILLQTFTKKKPSFNTASNNEANNMIANSMISTKINNKAPDLTKSTWYLRRKQKRLQKIAEGT